VKLLIKLTYLLGLITVLSCRPDTGSSEQATSPKRIYQSITPSVESQPYQVAFLIMNGVYNTELTAPYDVFHHTVFRDSIRPMKVFTIAGQSDPIITFEGLKIIPDFNYMRDEIPQIDILVVPSAEHHLDTDLEDRDLINFIKRTSDRARFVTSHCDGAFTLAKSRILSGYASTTFPSDISEYRRMFPSLDIRENVIFVHDGKFITSVGGAKSFEASLYLCELHYGKSVADQIAKGLVIDWDLSLVPHAVIGQF
jgi:transcriptional regulator GlxA family with amidase domain